MYIKCILNILNSSITYMKLIIWTEIELICERFIMHIGHSALSFALLEIGVPNNPLFSLLHQKIDFF